MNDHCLFINKMHVSYFTVSQFSIMIIIVTPYDFFPPNYVFFTYNLQKEKKKSTEFKLIYPNKN